MSHGTHMNESCHIWMSHYASWLIRMCAMTHSYVCHDSFICVPWFIHMCAMTHSYVCHDSFICVPWFIHMCAMTHSYVCHDSQVDLSSQLDKSSYQHKCRTLFSILKTTGWRRLIGSPKLQIIFHKRATKYRSFCGKWPIKIRDPMSLRHLVRDIAHPHRSLLRNIVSFIGLFCKRDLYF